MTEPQFDGLRTFLALEKEEWIKMVDLVRAEIGIKYLKQAVTDWDQVRKIILYCILTCMFIFGCSLGQTIWIPGVRTLP